jgi:hypothetical protein
MSSGGGVGLGGLIFGVMSAFTAKKKGFKSLRWILSLGLIGLFTVSALSSATTPGISPEEATRRADKANTIGAVMAWVNIVLLVVLTYFLAK